MRTRTWLCFQYDQVTGQVDEYGRCFNGDQILVYICVTAGCTHLMALLKMHFFLNSKRNHVRGGLYGEQLYRLVVRERNTTKEIRLKICGSSSETSGDGTDCIWSVL